MTKHNKSTDRKPQTLLSSAEPPAASDRNEQAVAAHETWNEALLRVRVMLLTGGSCASPEEHQLARQRILDAEARIAARLAARFRQIAQTDNDEVSRRQG